MTRQRYSIKESLNRLLRLFQGETVNEVPGALPPEVLSEDAALSDLAELVNNSLPGETFAWPQSFIDAGLTAGFATGTTSAYQVDIVSGTASLLSAVETISLQRGLDVSISGTVAYVDSSIGLGARVYNNANLAISSGAVTPLTFNSEYYDTDNIHDTGSNTGRLTCRTAGKYVVTAQMVSDTALTAIDDAVWIEHDSRGRVAQQAFSGGKSVTVECIIDLLVGDYLIVQAYQQTGSINLIYSAGNEYSPTFSMQRIG